MFVHNDGSSDNDMCSKEEKVATKVAQAGPVKAAARAVTASTVATKVRRAREMSRVSIILIAAAVGATSSLHFLRMQSLGLLDYASSTQLYEGQQSASYRCSLRWMSRMRRMGRDRN